MEENSNKALNHLAIIMDGNRRWAKIRGLQYSIGHTKGSNVLKSIIKKTIELNIKELSIFAFSTENWGRKSAEVTFLLKLFEKYLKSQIVELNTRGIKLNIIGNRDKLDESLVKLIEQSERITKNNNVLKLNVAINFGGLDDILFSIKKISKSVEKGLIKPDEIDENVFKSNLLSSVVNDIDLLIRTSGEMRISNFMLYQLRYSELYFTKTLWPDFDEFQLEKAIEFFDKCDRRYGKSSIKSAEN